MLDLLNSITGNGQQTEGHKYFTLGPHFGSPAWKKIKIWVNIVMLAVSAVLVQRTAPQGSPRTPATCIAATTPDWSSEFQNFGFKLLNNFKLFSKFNELQAYSLMMIC